MQSNDAVSSLCSLIKSLTKQMQHQVPQLPNVTVQSLPWNDSTKQILVPQDDLVKLEKKVPAIFVTRIESLMHLKSNREAPLDLSDTQVIVVDNCEAIKEDNIAVYCQLVTSDSLTE